MNDNSASCDGLGACWIQTGNSLGKTYYGSSVCKSPSIEAYMEEADINGYDCHAYISGQIGLAQTTFYDTFSTGNCNTNHDALMDAYVENDSGFHLVGQAWIPGCANATIYGQTEFDEFGGTGCPVLNGNEYFGYGSDSIQQMNASYNWVFWLDSGTNGPYAPLALTPSQLNGHDSFYVSG
ncbi:MAG: hypothetical protein ACYCUG_04170 [Acidimicrobiales bacterium]